MWFYDRFLESRVQATGKMFLFGSKFSAWRGRKVAGAVADAVAGTAAPGGDNLSLQGLGRSSCQPGPSCKKNGFCVQRIFDVAHGVAFFRHLIWLLGLFCKSIWKFIENKESNLNLPKQQWIRSPDGEPIGTDALSLCLSQESLNTSNCA